MTVNSMAPGIPKMLTKIIVKKFKPIWKPKRPPIKFISKIIMAPIKEFKNSLNTNFNGNMKILHNTNIIQSPEI